MIGIYDLRNFCFEENLKILFIQTFRTLVPTPMNSTETLATFFCSVEHGGPSISLMVKMPKNNFKDILSILSRPQTKWVFPTDFASHDFRGLTPCRAACIPCVLVQALILQLQQPWIQGIT